jgi:hypothetical protein
MEDFDAIKAVKHEYLTRIQQDGRAEILRLALRAMKQDGVEVLQWEQFTRDDGSFAIGITKGDHIAPNVLVFGRMLDELADLMEIVFGEAKRITIDRDGTLTVEEM